MFSFENSIILIVLFIYLEFEKFIFYADTYGNDYEMTKKNNILFLNNFIDKARLIHGVKDCRNKLPLPFDFFLPKYNLLIEYQGRQHFENNISFFHKKDSLEERQKLDQIKRNYCANNKIDLLEISYKDNIKEKLSKYLI